MERKSQGGFKFHIQFLLWNTIPSVFLVLRVLPSPVLFILSPTEILLQRPSGPHNAFTVDGLGWGANMGIGTGTWSLDSYVVGGKSWRRISHAKLAKLGRASSKRQSKKARKGREEVICKQDAALFEVNPCRRPLLEPLTQKSTELPWQIKRESQINNHCNLNQLAQCIRNRGGRSQTTTIALRWSSFGEISSSFVGALPEVRGTLGWEPYLCPPHFFHGESYCQMQRQNNSDIAAAGICRNF